MTENVHYPKRRREILVVSHFYESHGGGIERIARRLIDEFAANGDYHFTWAASAVAEDSQSDDDAPLTPGDETLLPMKGSNWLERMTGMPWPIWGLKSLGQLRAAVKRADLVWLHDAPYMGNIAAFRMAQTFRKPIVITQHIGAVPYRNPIARFLMQIADRCFTRPMLRRAQQTVFISDHVAESYHRRVAFKVPVMVIPNGVDPDIFYPADAEQRKQLRAQFSLRDDQPVVLFSGRFIDKKGLPVIEKLSQMLPEWRFWLAGHGALDPERWYRTNVHVFKGRSGASLAELYRAADLFILPSYGEGFPLVVQEAMACGLPVICSPATAAGSLLAKPFLLTAAVDPASPARTANAWAKRLKAQREYLPLPESNPDLAAAAHYFWSWPKIAVCYADLFANLLKRADP